MLFFILYILGLLFTINVCLIWFYSPLCITIGQLIFDKKLYTRDEFETRLLLFNPVIGKLLSCYICFSFWCSLLIGVLSIFFVDMPVIAPVITAGTYPALAYLYKAIIDRS